MKRADVIHKLGEIVDRYKFEPKTPETREKVRADLTEFAEQITNEWVLTINVFTVDDFALFLQVFLKHVSEQRPGRPEIIWTEEPIRTDTDSAYERAMGVIE